MFRVFASGIAAQACQFSAGFNGGEYLNLAVVSLKQRRWESVLRHETLALHVTLFRDTAAVYPEEEMQP
jgi:hypothetical protein